jgi:hypothetical protein
VQFITRESNIDVSYAKAYVDWTPDVNVTRDLGNGARRWKKLWVHDIDMTGAVIGGAGDYVTLTTNQTITGQKTFSPIGSLRTVEPMIVKVGSEGGQIDWEDDNGNWAYVNDVAGGSYFRLYRVASGGATFQVFALDGSAFNTEMQGGLHVRDYLRTFTNNAVDIGTSAIRFSTIYGYNFDGAPAGELGNFVRTRKVDLVDYVAGGGLLFDLRAAVSTGTGVPGAHRYMEARDNAGNPLYQLWRQQDGVPVNYSKWYQDFIPDTNNSRTMGNGSFRWSNVFGEIGNFNSIYQRDWKLIPYVPDANNSSWFIEDNYGTRQVEFVTREAGSDVVYAKAYVHWLPATDSTYTLGDAFRKWSTAYINNLQVVDVVGSGNFGTSGMLSGSTVTAAVVLTTQWSQQATMNTGSDQRWEFRDPSGVKQIEWVTREGGFDVQYARVAGDLTPDQNATYTLGNALRRWNTIWGTVGNFSSTVASTGYISNGNTGTTATLSCGAGQAIKQIVVNGGIVLNVVCGAP